MNAPMAPAGAGFWQSLATYAALDLLRRASFVVLLPLYLAWLPPEALGALVLYTVMAALLAIVANLRVDAAMRRFYFDFDGDRAAQDGYLAGLFSASLLFVIVSLAALALIGPWLYSALFADAQLAFYPLGLVALVTACINTALAPYFVFLRNRRALGAYSACSGFLVVGNLALQVVLITQFELGVAGALFGGLLPPAALLMYLLVTRPRHFLRWPDWRALAPSIRFSVPLVAFSLIYLLESRLDRFVIERFFDLEMVGVYGLLAALLGLSSIAMNALDASIRPWLYEALGQDDAQQAVRAFAAIYVGAGVLTLSVITLVGSAIGLLPADPRYLAVRDWMALGVTAFVPLLFTRFWGLVYLYRKQTIRLTFWTLARTILTLALLLILTPRFGVPGVLVALLVSQLANAVIFRVELARFGVTGVTSIEPWLQAASFVLVIWASRLALPDDAPVTFGVVQFAVMTVILFLMHRRTPARLQQVLRAPAPTITGVSP